MCQRYVNIVVDDTVSKWHLLGMVFWSPIVDSVVDSSLWTEPYYVRVLFVTLLALKDKNFMVHRSAFSIAQRAHMTEKEVLDGLKILSSPDKKRMEPQPFEGRRIEARDGGWFIINGKKYRDLIQQESRREYQAKWQREKRSSEAKGVMLTGKDADAFIKADGESWQARRKIAKEAGIKNGAQAAIEAGFNDSKQ